MADAEKVKPHKFANAWGTASIYGFVVGVPAAIINHMRVINSVGSDQAFFKFAKSPVTWALALAPLAATIVGAVKGWKRAGKEENYINSLEQQNAVLDTQLQVTAAESKKFTNIIQSRAGHGSHAAAHEAADAHSASAEAAR